MAADGEISGPPEVFIDPKQNILADSTLKVQFAVRPTGTARYITAFVNFVNPNVG